MNVILNFFTDTLSGYIYIITTIISILIILGIIGFLSERKFNLENNRILTKNYNNENEDEILLGDRTLYNKEEEMMAQSKSIPTMEKKPLENQDKITHRVNSVKDEIL